MPCWMVNDVRRGIGMYPTTTQRKIGIILRMIFVSSTLVMLQSDQSSVLPSNIVALSRNLINIYIVVVKQFHFNLIYQT